eukprot:SAG22_NODE_239_length_14182_cov_74.353050_8_plen_296_part_00
MRAALPASAGSVILLLAVAAAPAAAAPAGMRAGGPCLRWRTPARPAVAGGGRVKTDDTVSEYPWPWLNGGAYSKPPHAASLDPLVQYAWPKAANMSKLQLYNVSAKTIVADRPSSFRGPVSAGGPIQVEGEGCLLMDFGEENAGWLEFDAQGLPAAKDVHMSISEYNEPAIVNSGTKTAPATKMPGQGYRLVLNPLLYEGVRFGWICVRNFSTAWTLTDIRLVAQSKPQSYMGSFASSDALLDRIWYTGAFVVRANLGAANFGSILINRGDRTTWAGVSADTFSMLSLQALDVSP